MQSTHTPSLPSNTPTSSPYPRTPQSSDSSNMEKLTASILSTYDLPNNLKPLSVQMECHFDVNGDGNDASKVVLVETGPPVARHKDSNSFKFVQSGKEASPTGTIYFKLVFFIFQKVIIFKKKLNCVIPKN